MKFLSIAVTFFLLNFINALVIPIWGDWSITIGGGSSPATSAVSATTAPAATTTAAGGDTNTDEPDDGEDCIDTSVPQNTEVVTQPTSTTSVAGGATTFTPTTLITSSIAVQPPTETDEPGDGEDDCEPDTPTTGGGSTTTDQPSTGGSSSSGGWFQTIWNNVSGWIYRWKKKDNKDSKYKTPSFYCKRKKHEYPTVLTVVHEIQWLQKKHYK
ncbi:hypothetical protein G210_0075 [Candida maltosa Xu316]|uniref:Uncharacterized protein n=1 Tax=Candida maltosa (strain Xu316) TaxID=1245528 RepID=M3K1S5_CANMX|nr:hypothetical protein G210_0075 [Candida maltosa Xu316]